MGSLTTTQQLQLMWCVDLPLSGTKKKTEAKTQEKLALTNCHIERHKFHAENFFFLQIFDIVDIEFAKVKRHKQIMIKSINSNPLAPHPI